MSALEPRYPALSPEDNIAGPLNLSPLVLGAGVFGFDYNTADDLLESTMAEDAIRLCMRYGIKTLDTSPYYTTSEQVLGRVFGKIADEFPRESYQIITKAGRYGKGGKAGFDYSPEKVRASIKNSLELLKTDYIDGVYMHDVEFVSEQLGGAGQEGFTVDSEGNISASDLEKWGLRDEDKATIRGPGDEKVLAAMKVLFELKKEGVVRAVGFSGYPLPTLLRLARLVAAHLEPLDIMQSYCHHTLQNLTLPTFLPLFHAAGVQQVITASPLSMGLLRTAGAQPWHPASPALQAAALEAQAACENLGLSFTDVALAYGFSSAKKAGEKGGRETPTVVGLSTVEEVHETMKVYSEIYGKGEKRTGRAPGEGLSGEGEGVKKQLQAEKEVVEIFRRTKTLDWTWECGV